METIRYLRALVRSWWLVLIALIAGGAGGYLVYHQTTPKYQSEVRLIVGAAGGDAVSNAAINEATASQLASIANTNPAAASAYKQAGSPPGGFSVNASSGGSFVTISVSSANNLTAAKVANAYITTLRRSAATLGGNSGAYKLTTDFAAGPAADPYDPSRSKDVGIGLAAGLVLGLALAILREALNHTVRDSDGLRELTGLTIYGTVPLDGKRKLMPARTDSRSARAEAYRQIRTSILTRTTSRPLILAITSATVGEGKTSVATNVAAIFSRAGHRVAIVDADLRRPRVHTFFELRPDVGLSDVVTGRASLHEALVELDGGTLGVLPAGRIPEDPSELIGSEAMLDVLRGLASEYEFVIVDTPPVLPVTDALIIGPMTDGMLFVSKLQGTTDDRIIKALQSIERVNAEVLGIVPNQATLGGDRAYGYAYEYKYKDRKKGKNDVPDDVYAVPSPADPALVSLDVSRPRRDPAEAPAAPAPVATTTAEPAAADYPLDVAPPAEPAPAEPVVEHPVLPQEDQREVLPFEEETPPEPEASLPAATEPPTEALHANGAGPSDAARSAGYPAGESRAERRRRERREAKRK